MMKNEAGVRIEEMLCQLADATRCVLEIGLGIIGVTAPEKM